MAKKAASRRPKSARAKTTRRPAAGSARRAKSSTKKAKKAKKTTKAKQSKKAKVSKKSTRATKATKPAKKRASRKSAPKKSTAKKSRKAATRPEPLPESYQLTSGRAEPGPDGFAPVEFRQRRGARHLGKGGGINAGVARDGRARFGTSHGELNSRSAPSPGSARQSQVTQNRDH
jgi:hypothetical protein